MKNRCTINILMIICFLTFTKITFSQYGQLDNSFGNGGKVITALNILGSSKSYASVMQSDGKVVEAGYTTDPDGYNVFALARYNIDGSLDINFGDLGTVLTQIGTSGASAYSVAIQNDGKIVVAGFHSNGNNNHVAIVRYNTDGSLDNSFGINGIDTISTGNSDSEVKAVAIQNDGKIVVAGKSFNGNDDDFLIARYKTNGNLDNTFGDNGIIIDDISSDYDGINALQIQNDGKILVAGYSTNGNDEDFILARYNSDGSSDNSFGINGIVENDLGSAYDVINSLAIQGNGKIVAAGIYNNGSNFDFALARYNSVGEPDSTFGTNGFVITQIGSSDDQAYSVKIQDDGKILAAGSTYNGTKYDFAAARYNVDGSLDNTFGTNGTISTQIGFSDDYARSAVLQNNGKIITTGYSEIGNDYNFAAVRFNTNGVIDDSFGENGFVTTQVGFSYSQCRSVAIQNDGKILAAGSSSNGDHENFAVVRYNVGGTPDNTFGTNGVETTQVGSSYSAANSMAIQNDGKIIAAGYSNGSNGEEFTMIRYKTNGFIDTSFGSNGIVTTEVNGEAYSVIIQNDGKLVLAGDTYNGSNQNFTVTRYNTDGSIDNTFGTNGIVTTQIMNSNSYVNSAAIQNDGKIVVAGQTLNGSERDFTMIRYNPDGSLDNTFGTNGILILQVGESNSGVGSVTIQDNGKIVAAGYSYVGGKDHCTVVRLNTDGSPDNTFGTNGVVNTIAGSDFDGFNSVLIQSNGKIVAAGYTSNGTYQNFVVVRYLLNGDLDNTFGTDGIVTTGFTPLSADALSAAIQSDGKIVVAGYTEDNGYNNSFFTLARYTGETATSVSEENNASIPNSFSLKQNFPNPFNPTTIIQYTIPESDHVTLKIFNTLGEEVKTLVNGYMQSGSHKVVFNASTLSSGVYLYRIETKNFTSVRKMILLK